MYSPGLYWLLAALKIALVFLPQSGYIHPDEFFQGPEVVAGDVLHVGVYRSWEFNASSAVRSITLPYLICGPIFYALRLVAEMGFDYTNTYALLVIPRLFVAILSLVMDYLVFNTARYLKKDGKSCVVVFASSYVALIFYTRTFSNTLEAFLFVSLVYFVAQTLWISEGLEHGIKTNQPHQPKRKKHDPGKVRHTKSHRKGDKDEIFFPGTISFIIVSGIFNRPTFLAFLIVPLLVWLFSGFSNHGNKRILKFLARKIVHCAFYMLFFTAVFVICDSLYYGSLKLDGIFHEVKNWNVAAMIRKNMTLTPLNFLRYNVNSSNVAAHGLHPRITHLLVNTPMLFGPLAVISLYELIFTCTATATSRGSFWAERRVPFMLLAANFLPIFILSMIPHQEPRFLIPLLVIQVLLYSDLIVGAKSYTALKAAWVIFNVLGALLFGVAHQGGLVPCLTHLQQVIKSDTHQQHIVFYHTYMPPRHLLTIPQDRYVEGTASSKHVMPSGGIFVYDLQGASSSTLDDQVKEIVSKSGKRDSLKVIVVAPSTLKLALPREYGNSQLNYSYKLKKQFLPHLSMEDPPDILSLFQRSAMKNENSLIKKIQQEFSLNLYEIEIH